MKPLTLDLSIYDQFNFAHPPIGVNFLLAKPDGIKRLDKKLAFCGMISEAQRQGQPFYIDIENHGCPPGTKVLGCEMPRVIDGGYLGPELHAFKAAYANRRVLNTIPTFERKTVEYVVFCPIQSLSHSPDLVVIVTDNVSQTEILLRAFSYTTGRVLQSKMTSVLGCAWLYAYPYISGEVNYITAGIGFGMKVNKAFPDGRQVISIPYDWLPTITLNLREMMWEPPSYTGDDPDFDKKLFAKLGLSLEA